MAKYKIIANAPVTCYGYGMWFNAGVAETDNKEIAEYLKKKGYTVEVQTSSKTSK